ncbi:MAG: family 10 glycosylhydrolase [Betaproteobacteria bacterium]
MAISVLLCGLAIVAGCANDTTSAANTAGGAAFSVLPPPVPREFRAAWVATVANIDWPSKKGLPVEQQRQEIIRIVERAKELNLNAIIFQVRPAADALYASPLEPWSEYLTGEQGKPPEPFYDPLAMWIEESHKRGLELHAWFNPYRARHTSAKGPQAKSHVANTHPAVVKEYGGYLWMDPAEPFAAQRSIDVILDVVRRYDVDGVHVDDYFYPYPVALNPGAPPTENAPELDFPDEPAWSRYILSGGRLSRADWRRQNVNQLIERIYNDVHREKLWVKVGVSPFGIGRPDRRPPGIAGFSQYDKLYADVELWFRSGWLDYLAPQLYWPIEQAPQAFGTLMEYWIAENTAGRHLWPGLFTSRIDSSAKSWKPEDITNQIAMMRNRKPVGGHIHFSMVTLMENRRDVNEQLKRAYQTPALVPATPWLDNVAPATPIVDGLAIVAGRPAITLQLSAAPGKAVSQYAVWSRYGGEWQLKIVPIDIRKPRTEVTLAAASTKGALSAVSVSAIDRMGNESKSIQTIYGTGGMK